MPDLTKGHTFSSGEEVDHTKLNNLVGNAIINDGVVDSSALADSSVTNAKVSATAAIALSKLATGSDAQVIVGSSGGVPAYVAMSGDTTISNAGAVTIGADKITTAKILDDNITTAKILDANVTTAKLAALDPSPAGSFTSASVTINSAGQVTAASSGGAVSHPTARLQGFTADGTWTAPTGVTRAKFTIVGAGGSGCDTSNESGGGGGCAIVSAVVVPATAYAITVGEGVSQANSNNGRGGGDSTVVVGATTYTGGGGGGASTGALSTSGGTGTNGDVNFSGSVGKPDWDGGGGYSFLGPVHGRGSYSSATSSDGFVLVEWME